MFTEKKRKLDINVTLYAMSEPGSPDFPNGNVNPEKLSWGKRIAAKLGRGSTAPAQAPPLFKTSQETLDRIARNVRDRSAAAAQAEQQKKSDQISPEERSMMVLGEKVRTEAVELLAHKHPTYGESDEVWSKVGLFDIPGVTYGEVKVNRAGGIDEWGSRPTFRRDILDESGKVIGRWEKFGFYQTKDNLLRKQDGTLRTFSETLVFTEGERTSERIQGSIYQGKLTSVQAGPFDPSVGEFHNPRQILYRYDETGNVRGTEYRHQKDWTHDNDLIQYYEPGEYEKIWPEPQG